MSIAPTRKVGSSTTALRAEKSFAAAHQNSQFVEMIDTNNNVLVRDENKQHHSQQQAYDDQETPPQEQGQAISADTAYVASSIEVLAGSGVFEETATAAPNHHKVGVYDNNQSIIRDEEIERTGRNYLKHFYEKNEHLIDVDELV